MVHFYALFHIKGTSFVYQDKRGSLFLSEANGLIRLDDPGFVRLKAVEFHEKLQKLRANANLTQEELAEKLYVSRAAISKWESGRGYPSIDSLRAIADFFHVTVDHLICGEEMIALAEQDIKESSQKITTLICGVLDCLIVLLLFLPAFGDDGASVALPAMTGISVWLKTVFLVTVGLTALNGFCTAVISGFEKPKWNQHRLVTGMALSVLGTVLFILTRQPYAGSFYLFLLVVKGVLLWKSK